MITTMTGQPGEGLCVRGGQVRPDHHWAAEALLIEYETKARSGVDHPNLPGLSLGAPLRPSRGRILATASARTS